MCKSIQTQTFQSKTSLIEKLGGESQMSFFLMNFCESINEDTDLKMVFNHMGMNRLSTAMGNLIKTAFKSNFFDNDVRLSIIMKNYAVFELGINSGHFKKLKAHFEAALCAAWVEQELLEECMQRFAALQSVFEEEGRDIEGTVMVQRAIENRILA